MPTMLYFSCIELCSWLSSALRVKIIKISYSISYLPLLNCSLLIFVGLVLIKHWSLWNLLSREGYKTPTWQSFTTETTSEDKYPTRNSSTYGTLSNEGCSFFNHYLFVYMIDSPPPLLTKLLIQHGRDLTTLYLASYLELATSNRNTRLFVLWIATTRFSNL